MQEEYQKTIILLSIIFIFGGLYATQFFDIGGSRRNNVFLFMILVLCVLVGYLQTKRIKRWRQENKTDYFLVYWCYFYLTLGLLFYLMYIVGTRSELECMRLLRINMSGAGNKMIYKLSNLRNNSNSNIDIDMSSNSTGDNSNLSKYKSTVGMLFRGYKSIWKKMLFMKG